MLKAITNFATALWDTFNSPNNDPIVLGLLIAVGALLFSHLTGYFNYRKILGEKDARIKDLVQQRNLFQEMVLCAKDVKRKTTIKPSSKK